MLRNLVTEIKQQVDERIWITSQLHFIKSWVQGQVCFVDIGLSFELHVHKFYTICFQCKIKDTGIFM